MLLPILVIAGCSAESRRAPVSSANASGGSSHSEPESANSLPRGAAVSEPLTGVAGNVQTSRVPGTAVAAPRAVY
jgi:hypothetical protein